MSRSDRIQPIKDLADTRERDAGATVATARAALDACTRQLEQLRGYRDEYLQRAGAGAADPVRMQNFQAFIGRLGDAIRQQETAVAGARAELERAETAWQALRVEAASLGKAVAKIEAGERKVRERREQREADEQSADRAARPRD